LHKLGHVVEFWPELRRGAAPLRGAFMTSRRSRSGKIACDPQRPSSRS
jgi:hypothetical protein